MSQLWQVGKQMWGSMLGQLDDEDFEGQCNGNGNDWPEDEDNDLQESSGIGTVIVMYTVLAGLFIGANLIPSQLTQGFRSQRDREMLKEQQQRRIIQLVNDVTIAQSKKNAAENWQDALEPNAEEDTQRSLKLQQNQQTSHTLTQTIAHKRESLQEIYYDLHTENSEEDHFKDALEEH